MEITGASAKESFKAYFEGKRAVDDRYSVELEGGIGALDPLYMLDMASEPSLTNRCAVVATVIKGKKVTILDEGVEVKAFTFNEGSLSTLFVDEPYLLSPVIDCVFSLVLKKLTPPSKGSKDVAAK